MEDKQPTKLRITSTRAAKPRLQKTGRRAMQHKRSIHEHGRQTSQKNARLSNRVHSEEIQQQSIRASNIRTTKTIHANDFKQMKLLYLIN